jgi:diaminopimelate decarboxylase
MIRELSSLLQDESIRTPVFIFDLELLAERALQAQRAWAQVGEMSFLAYPYKANAASKVVSTARHGYQYADVSSNYEFLLAIRDGFIAQEVLWGGPAKSVADIASAMHHGCWLKVDSLDEVDNIERLSKESDLKGKFMVRLAHMVDRRWSRFGLIPEEAVVALLRLHNLSNDPVGVHIHIGRTASHPDALAGVCLMYGELIRLASKLAANRSAMLFSVGGGFAHHPSIDGIASANGHSIDIGRSARLVRHELSQVLDVDNVRMVAEPGRSVLQGIGTLVSRVISRKRRDDQWLIVLDSSITLMRSSQGSLSSISFEPIRSEEGELEIVGACCFESDVIARLHGAVPEVGDLVRFCDMGAYDFATVTPWFRDPIEVRAMIGGALIHVDPRWSIAA